MTKSSTTKSAAKALPMFAADTVHTVELSALLSMLRAHKASWMDGAVNRRTDDWNGNMSYDEALNAAELGQWSAPTIPALTLPELTSQSDDMRYYNDFIGSQLDIAAYCSGEPEYWQVAEPIAKPVGRVIRLAVEIGGLGDVDARHLKNRGEAIVALVNSLELQGHSVEVTVVRAFANKAKNNYQFLIPIKHAGQALDIKRFQFIIGHPAFYRRCLFGLAELAQGVSMDDCTTYTQSFAPNGFVHIRYTAGLGEANTAIDWATQFAQSFNESQN